MYVNLDTAVHRNMYALAFREPQEQFPRITKSTDVTYRTGSLTPNDATTVEVLIEMTMGNATNIMNGVPALSGNINDALMNSLFITISEPGNPPSSEMSSIGLNAGESG